MTIMSGPPTELSQRELPAEENGHHDPELDHEVGGGELEHHCRREIAAPAKDRARHRDRGVGAGGSCRPEAAGDPERAGRIVREQATHLRLGDDGLHRRRERKAKDQRPEDFPEHAEGEAERVAELG
jgi:hypothetical protein